MKKRIIQWLINRYLKGYHLAKNPSRKEPAFLRKEVYGVEVKP